MVCTHGVSEWHREISHLTVSSTNYFVFHTLICYSQSTDITQHR